MKSTFNIYIQHRKIEIEITNVGILDRKRMDAGTIFKKLNEIFLINYILDQKIQYDFKEIQEIINVIKLNN